MGLDELGRCELCGVLERERERERERVVDEKGVKKSLDILGIRTRVGKLVRSPIFIKMSPSAPVFRADRSRAYLRC